jgi:hypothetical protein
MVKLLWFSRTSSLLTHLLQFIVLADNQYIDDCTCVIAVFNDPDAIPENGDDEDFPSSSSRAS